MTIKSATVGRLIIAGLGAGSALYAALSTLIGG
jgi:hypothetical protein